jgi:hypothetical protein
LLDPLCAVSVRAPIGWKELFKRTIRVHRR